MFFRRLAYRWFEARRWFFKFKLHNIIELGYSKIQSLALRKKYWSFTKSESKYWHNHSHKNQKLLELKHIWTRNRIFFLKFCSAHTLFVNKNTMECYKKTMRILLCWPFTRHVWKAVFFAPSENRHSTYLLNILKQTTQNSAQEEMKNISPTFISLLTFAFPENSYFHTIFTILVLAQIRRIICWGKKIKRTQMKWFLYLIIQDCQAWIGIYLEKLNVWTSIRICKMCRINIVCQ